VPQPPNLSVSEDGDGGHFVSSETWPAETDIQQSEHIYKNIPPKYNTSIKKKINLTHTHTHKMYKLDR
jgi:hypothetical protein